ncbi:tRNA(Ile)-lysidine synthetase [Corynebacterium tuscaniense DNF00037]|nr:tRNA(Ile)-lysidine synthetase [Corynebacterium tuscaniense DNF00037]
MAAEPFWPRVSPHFVECRRAVRAFDAPALIGLSGGPDSLALVAAAVAEGKDARAVVVDHGLQEGSVAVAQRAAAVAQRLGVHAEVVSVGVAPTPGESVEAVAREARYAALSAAARRDGRDIWVAHTREDQAETLLLGALRGNPVGMSSVSFLENGRRLARPFLTIRRADTVGACEELELDPWHDPMNEDLAYRRVAVRQSIIPTLADLIGGDAVPALARTADRIAADQELLASLVNLSPTNNCATLAADPTPIRQRRIMAWLRDAGVNVGGAPLAAIDQLCVNWCGQGPVAIGGGLQVVRRSGELIVEKRA